jgi:glycosyltransferase involved in cell wall biosynthesis
MMKNISFVFNEGRKKRLSSDRSGPKEFFYSFEKFQKDFPSTTLIEMDVQQTGVLSLFFKIIRKFSKIPIFTENLLKISTIRTILKSDILIATNQNIGYSLVPFLYFKKKFRPTNLYVFSMGILENIIDSKINKYIIHSLLKNSTKLLFISKNEYKNAISIFPNFKNKFKYIPFCIDTDYWHSDVEKTSQKKILFIGNDRFRNYDLLLEIAKEMPDLSFTLLTNKITECSLENVKLLNGSWKENKITDFDVKKLYEENYLTILPIVETNQPSGQSVCLQSMSLKTPVIISKTKGFWDEDNFIDDEHIVIVKENTVEAWVKEIRNLVNNIEKYSLISRNGKVLIDENFNLEILYKALKNELIF